ncbi:transmembrane protein 82-like isoform X2 [Corythoichthys intestinalis]|uniref:transmembrane protein 82-like isoform X2 n=1 Tax=Corythoichthys intestinalis TaxID=161448 RepID=UPI0025A51F96|nr:transmembrane protein 82-like isoform X2 [Corythoichthys intestinalis]XP_061813668.1 transmembrane protein 82-like [Nerophis lumbriciformis]
MIFLFSWILDSIPSDSNLIDCLFQGVIAACGVSVLCSLMRVYYFTQMYSNSETDSKETTQSSSNPLSAKWRSSIHFWALTGILSVVGPRLSSLIVLEFSLRVVSAWVSARLDAGGRDLGVILIQSHFSLGCSITCSLYFLHQGAPHSSLSLFLAAALSWALASWSNSLWRHVGRLYSLHSKERYCGRCITLLSSGHTLLAFLQRLVILVFAVAVVASFATVYDHFLSQKEALKFWTPLTLCYTMLVVYNQEDQQRQMGAEALLHTVVLRLGALLVLMLTVGNWSDVVHVLFTFLGEGVCLLFSQDLLHFVLKDEEDPNMNKYMQSSSYRKREHTSGSSSKSS